jgi:hypothetical protein
MKIILSQVWQVLDWTFDLLTTYTTGNYSATANLHNSQITIAPAKSFATHSVFSRPFLVTASNNGYSSASVLKSSLNGGSLPIELFSCLSLMLLPTIQSASLSWNKAPVWGLRPDFYYRQTVSCLLIWGGSLWQEDGSVVYNFCCGSPTQSFSGPSPLALVTMFHCLRSKTSLFVASYDSQGYGGGIRPRLDTGRLSLMLRPMVSRPVCHGIKHPSRAYDQSFINVWQLRVLMWALSLTRRRVCRLQFLLRLASAVILGSEYLGTCDHVLLSQIQDFPFRRLLQLAGLQWMYSTPPPHALHTTI